MAAPQSDTDLQSWSLEDRPLRIEYAAPVLEDLCAAAVEGQTRFRHGGIEVGGVLYGTREGETVRILEHRPLECEHAFGPRFVLSDGDRARLRDLLAAPARDADLKGLIPVGWYHSHTRSAIGMSPRDLETYDRFFTAGWQIALVVRPDPDAPAEVGFFFRQPAGDVAHFDIEIAPRRRAKAAAAAAAAAGAAAPGPAPDPVRVPEWPEPAPVAPALPAEVAAARPQTVSIDLPSFAIAPAPPPRRLRWWWAALTVVGLAAATFGVFRYLQATAPKTPLSLWVADLGGQLMIEWDRAARPIRESRGGTLEIADGGERQVIEMDADRLKEGSVDYVRHSEIVDVRLRVQPASGPELQELIRFVGQPVARTLAPEQLVRERDELRLEVEKLRAEVARLRPAASKK